MDGTVRSGSSAAEIDAIIFSGINDISRIFRFKSALHHPTNFPRSKMTRPNRAWMQKWAASVWAEMGGIRMERTLRYGHCASTYGEEATGCSIQNHRWTPEIPSEILRIAPRSSATLKVIIDMQEEQNLEVRISYFYETVRQTASISSAPVDMSTRARTVVRAPQGAFG